MTRKRPVFVQWKSSSFLLLLTCSLFARAGLSCCVAGPAIDWGCLRPTPPKSPLIAGPGSPRDELAALLFIDWLRRGQKPGLPCRTPGAAGGEISLRQRRYRAGTGVLLLSELRDLLAVSLAFVHHAPPRPSPRIKPGESSPQHFRSWAARRPLHEIRPGQAMDAASLCHPFLPFDYLQAIIKEPQ